MLTPAQFRKLSAHQIADRLQTGELDHLQQVPLVARQIEELDNLNPALIEILIEKQIIFSEEVKFVS